MREMTVFGGRSAFSSDFLASFVMAVSLVWIAGAGAVQGQDYGLYRVINIDAVDSLDVHETASPISAILTELSATAEMVEVLEEESGWGRILVNGVEGWVSMAYLTPMPRPRAGHTQAPGGFICAGTEPFWGLEIETTGQFGFHDAQTFGETRRADLTRALTASSRPYPYSYRFQGDVSGIAIIDRAECSDGMSDFDYGWRVFIEVQDAQDDPRLMEGCCRTPVRQ